MIINAGRVIFEVYICAMRIGYDAKRIFHNASGLGNYGRDIIRILSVLYPLNEYILFNPHPRKIKKFNTGNNIHERLPANFFGQTFPFYWRRFSITNQIKKERLNLYHGLTGELPHSIIKTNVPTVVTIHDLIFMRYPQWYHTIDRFIYTYKAKAACRQADHVVAISHQTKKDIVELLNIPANKISVIYQTCHPAFKENYTSAQKKQLVERLSLPDKFILNVSTIEERKNLLTVVKSLLHHNLPLFVVGKKTSYCKKVISFIQKNNLHKRVSFINNNISMQELAILYQLANVFCYPSIIEGFGIPIIEALYSKTPVITSNYGCFSEAGGPGSFYIEAFDDESLAKIIIRLQNDEALYNATVETGYKHAQQFNDDIIAGDIMQLYAKIARPD